MGIQLDSVAWAAVGAFGSMGVGLELELLAGFGRLAAIRTELVASGESCLQLVLAV